MPNLERADGDFKRVLPAPGSARVRRRDFVAAVAAGLLWPAPPGAPWRPRARRSEWTFRLDDWQRWSLRHRSGAAAVADAEILVLLDGADAIALGDLDDVRRFALTPPAGGSAGWQVIGGAASVEITALFLDGPPALISVAERGLAAERTLAEVRFLDSHTATVAGLATARVLVNGPDSSSECAVMDANGGATATGHWQTALLPAGAGAGLALSFGAEDAADGRFDVGDGLVATARFGSRPVSMALPPASASLAVVPGPDPLGALRRLASGALSGRPPLSGWASGEALGAGASEEAVLAALETARQDFDPRAFRLVRLDAGYQRSLGDWDTNDRFPHGHRWLTDQIHAAGFKAGLWLMPFAVSRGSGIPTAHPEWLLQSPEGAPLVVAEREDWGGAIYGLDAGQPPVRDYLRELARHAVRTWGYDHLALDGLEVALAGTRPGRRIGPPEAYRAGLRALREGADTAYLVACGAPLQHAAGLVDGMRVTGRAAAAFPRLRAAARSLLLRSHLHRAAWINDADRVPAGDPLTADEARAWASVVALCGATAPASERLETLPEERLAILRRLMPVAPVQGRPLDIAAAAWSGDGPDAAPAWVLTQLLDDWWMLAGVNWDDEPQQLTLSLAEHGLRGALAAYDVWADARVADVSGRLRAALAPHAAVLLSLRRPRRVPFVLGATRHLVQGVMDLEDERWDGRRRVLSARAVLLDGRPHAVTVAVPPGYAADSARCDPDAAIALEDAGPRAVRLVMPEPAAAEVDWEIAF